MKKTIKIEGMSCLKCVGHVKEALSELDGVDSIEVSLKDKQAVIECNSIENQIIINVLDEFGYEVISIE